MPIILSAITFFYSEIGIKWDMFDLHQLKQFICVVENKTISRAALELNITQPALTRSIQNLEYELGVTLFNRYKNRIELNDNGIFIYGYARNILSEARNLENAVRAFDRKNSILHIGSCAPLPLFIKLEDMITELFEEMQIEIEIRPVNDLLEGLNVGTFDLIILPREYPDDNLFNKSIIREQLYAIVDENSDLIKEIREISFKELSGRTILLMPLQGYWNDLVVEKIKNAYFLSQKDIGDYERVVQSSTLISFTSDLIMKAGKILDKRVAIPVTDACAVITYTCTCLKENQKRFERLFAMIDKIES